MGLQYAFVDPGKSRSRLPGVATRYRVVIRVTIVVIIIAITLIIFESKYAKKKKK